jgi:serine protease Do
MRRFLIAAICLSGTVGMLLGLVIAGSLTPAPAVSFPGDVALAPSAPPVSSAPPVPGGVASPVSFADAAERVNPAVVNIDSLSGWGSPSGASAGSRADAPQENLPAPRDRGGVKRGTGTGFIIDADGYILTNDHVVQQAERLTVRLKDGRSLRARHIGSDPDTDIALIKVDAPAPLPFAPLGNSDRLRVGEWVLAIGNPLAYEHTVTVGVVSFIGRKLFDTSLDRYIQTDAAINFGNSGGPLIDSRGEVVGINAAISYRASNIGFAVPINQARAILPQLRQGRVTRGYIGLSLRDVDERLQRSLKLRSSSGALVQDVTRGSPGERAGLRVYDVVVAVDGRAITGNDQLIRYIAARVPGTNATLQIVRNGRPLSVTVKLAERPRSDAHLRDPEDIERPAPSGRFGPSLGLSVRSLDAQFVRSAKLPAGMTGVIVSRVEPMSPAFDAQIQQGHVLLEINRQPVRSVEEFDRIIAAAGPGDVLTCFVYQPDRLQRSLMTLTID